MESTYPRIVVLESPELKDLLVEKGKIIEEGRKISAEIESFEADMTRLEAEIVEAEKAANIEDLNDEAAKITEEFNAVVAKMDDVKKRMYERVNAVVPPELKKNYELAEEGKKKLEKDRYELALKAQEINFKAGPLGAELLQPMLQDEFEDYESLKIDEKSGQVIGTIYSHLEEFKTRHREKVAKQKEKQNA